MGANLYKFALFKLAKIKLDVPRTHRRLQTAFASTKRFVMSDLRGELGYRLTGFDGGRKA